jgi:hypothetical protein
MLLRHDVLAGIESGRIDVVFRWWDRPRVRAGSRLRTAVGVVEVLGIDEITNGSLTGDDAAAGGFESVPDAIASAGSRGLHLYRIRLRYAGPDPRVALRQAIPDETEIDEIRRRLHRLDSVSSHGPWSWQTLRLIADQPGVRAEDLATSVGREKMPFKLDVRKLKELGLTESLPVGYRLSPRGEALLAAHD